MQEETIKTVTDVPRAKMLLAHAPGMLVDVPINKLDTLYLTRFSHLFCKMFDEELAGTGPFVRNDLDKVRIEGRLEVLFDILEMVAGKYGGEVTILWGIKKTLLFMALKDDELDKVGQIEALYPESVADQKQVADLLGFDTPKAMNEVIIHAFWAS